MKRLLTIALLTLTAGCGGADGPALLTTPDASYLFDTDNGPSSTHTFVITNRGGQSTTALSAQLSGDVTEFTFVSDGCTNRALRGGSSCQIEVQLAAEVAGSYAAQLHVFASGVSVTVDLSGRVTPSSLTALPPTAPINSAAGILSKATVTVHNGGGATSGILSVSAPAGAIVDDGCTGKPVSGGGSCSFDVEYSPPPYVIGPQTLSVEVGDGTAQPLTVTVSFNVGTSTAGLFAQDDGDFGAEDPTARTVKIFDISNQAPNPPGLLAVSLVDGDENAAQSSPFILTSNGCSSATIAPWASCRLELNIDPTLAPADYHATLLVTAGGKVALSVPLHVTTTPSHVTVSFNQSGNGSGWIATPFTVCEPVSQTDCGSQVIGNGAPTTFYAFTNDGVSTFAGWTSGPCAGSVNAVCTVTPSGSDLALGVEFTK